MMENKKLKNRFAICMQMPTNNKFKDQYRSQNRVQIEDGKTKEATFQKCHYALKLVSRDITKTATMKKSIK